MWPIFIVAAISLAVADDLPPSCDRPVYCNSALLHHVQTNRLFPDSKTFVDLQMRNDETTTLNAFDALLNQTDNKPTKEQLLEFVDQHFHNASELEAWTPTDYTDDPSFLLGIRDEKLRLFAKNINAIWPTLGRKVKAEVFEKPKQYSFIPVSNGFIIPGGRFRELYYWDAYWIVEGLLISGMQDTAKGMIENLMQLLDAVKKIPNGSRCYYKERSQPPLLTAMMSLYIRDTSDMAFLKDNIESLEKEVQYWLDTQIVTFDKGENAFTLLCYNAPSAGPRPESYYEDYRMALEFSTEADRTDFYIDLKSAAESGWDFSSRWLMNDLGENTGNLSTIHTRHIVPVDLNSIFANALQNLMYFQALLGNAQKSKHWGYLAKQWRSSIEQVLWDETDGVWYDYDMKNSKHRKYFYPSNVAPLWMGALEKDLVKKKSARVLDYLKNSHGLDFEGGIPSSLIRSGEQWDFPNAWPPLVSIVVNALEALESDASKKIAFKVAQTWVRSNHKGFLSNKQMFEKYDAEVPGRVGGGGEYTVQDGFGWSNGVVLEFLAKYGRTLTADDGNATSVESGYGSDSSPASLSSSTESDSSSGKSDSDSSKSEDSDSDSSDEYKKVIGLGKKRSFRRI